MLTFVEYFRLTYHRFKEGSFVRTGLLLGSFDQFSVELPSEYAGFHPSEAAEPPSGGDYPLHE
jgi:hypothetical protein